MIAIDPGSSSGAIVWGRGIPQVQNMPATVRGIWDLLVSLREDGPVVMENVGHGFPGNSSKSMFTFAKHRGHLDMALAALFKPEAVQLVLPSKWMHDLYGDRLPGGRRKEDKKARKDFIWADMVNRYASYDVTKRNADAFGLWTWGQQEDKR